MNSPEASAAVLGQLESSIPAKDRVTHSFAFRNRGPLGALLLGPVVLFVVFSKPLIEHDTPADYVMEGTGLLFFLAYVFFRFWSTMYIGDRKEKEVVCEGPYSICRNPLYVGSFCAALSVVLLIHSVSLLAATLLGILFYRYFVIPNEEAFLRSRFGASFDQYVSRTPRLFPKPAAYRSSQVVQVNLPGMRRELKRVAYATGVMLCLFPLCHLRDAEWWPHLFTLP
jgi:protein-S-isoprenylcysteine O-methyltransferase Ste14